jgi:pyridoxine 5-phosphate synthase
MSQIRPRLINLLARVALFFVYFLFMRLAINIDHVATIRNARGGREPDPIAAAHLCELAGAEGIVCHLREDRRHIKDRDVRILRETVKTKFDLEMGASDEIIRIALETKPDLVTLVPEKRQELTTEGGLDIMGQKARLQDVIARFHSERILVSLFLDPKPENIETAKEIGSDIVEIHTGEYANANSETQIHEQLLGIKEAATLAKSIGLGVNAGHGLDYINTAAVAAIKAIDEMSIGHAIITRALFVGIDRAVKQMLEVLERVKR